MLGKLPRISHQLLKEGEIMKMRDCIEQIRALALDYARCDGDHHKQWALCEIAKLAGAFDEELPDEDDRGMPD